jgi:photosystem II stability/assembly factor-like uncharacterized protein
MKKNKLFLIAAVAFFLAWTAGSYGQTWTFCVGSPTGLGANPSISVVDANIVWACGGAPNAPKVVRSTDGGVTFTVVTGNMTATPETWCIWAVDANTAYVGDGGAASGAGGNAKVWKTTNGGTLWTTIFTTGGTAGFINSIVFSRTNPQVGFIQSDPPTGVGGAYWLQKTTDGGTTWTLTSPPGVSGQASSQNGLAVIDAQCYGFGLGNTAPARYRWTTDGGTTWNLASTTLITGGFVSGLAISTNKLNWLAITDASMPNILRSTNTNSTFAAVNIGGGVSGYGTVKYVPGTSYCYISSAVGASGCVLESTNDGSSWTVMGTSGITGLTHMDVAYINGQIIGYAIASDGSIIRLTKYPTGIDPNNTGIPTSYALQQNYPNPFNPSTTVRFSLPNSGDVSLKVYDLVGHEVMTVVNGYKAAGNYVETIDASGLASGIYFYTIRAGNYVETKKMSLVK